MTFRKTTKHDIARVCEIFDGARETMHAQGIDQWTDGYPAESDIVADMEAGESYISVEPIRNAKIAGHFRHPGAHGLLITAQRFQSEGQFMPNLVGNQLVIRVLHYIADFGGLVFGADLLHGNAAKENFTRAFAMRCQNRLQMPQQRSLSGAGFATKDNIFAFFNGKRNVFQRFTPSGCGVGKAEILDLEMCHWMVSLICKITGIRR